MKTESMNSAGFIRTGPASDEIKNLFSSIASKYDLANDIITFGMARRWRRNLVRWSSEGLSPIQRVLDCATGTGDIAFEFARTFQNAEVIGCDFCEPMLKVASNKITRKFTDAAEHIRFELADTMSLPYRDAQFDVSSIAYGIRNVKDVPQALAEMARVTRPGGYVMILETGVVENRFLRAFVHLHFQAVVPFIGGLISGRQSAYQYLQKSSSEFPSGDTFCDVLRSVNRFSKVEYRPLLGGASYIYRAQVR